MQLSIGGDHGFNAAGSTVVDSGILQFVRYASHRLDLNRKLTRTSDTP